jgi:excisionase family DNA binding protein
MPSDTKHKTGSARRAELTPFKPPPTLASLFANLHATPHLAQAHVPHDGVSDDDVIDVGEACRLLRVGRNKVYEMVACNEIPHRRFGRRIRFSRTAIMRWLDSWSPRIAKEGQ